MQTCSMPLQQPVITISWIQYGAGAQLGAICIATAASAEALGLTLLPTSDLIFKTLPFKVTALHAELWSFRVQEVQILQPMMQGIARKALQTPTFTRAFSSSLSKRAEVPNRECPGIGP